MDKYQILINLLLMSDQTNFFMYIYYSACSTKWTVQINVMTDGRAHNGWWKLSSVHNLISFLNLYVVIYTYMYFLSAFLSHNYPSAPIYCRRYTPFSLDHSLILVCIEWYADSSECPYLLEKHSSFQPHRGPERVEINALMLISPDDNERKTKENSCM